MNQTHRSHSAVLLEQMRGIVGDEHVLIEPDQLASYCTDWTRLYSGRALAVVRPASTAEVARLLRLLNEHGQPLVVQGGNTSLVAGAVPAQSDGGAPVILSTLRLHDVGPVDQLTGQLTAQAGALLSSVQAAAQAAGWIYGVDLAARESATIGGNVATNAGGTKVVAYGMTRAQVVGVEAVLADGTVMTHLTGLLKDNTGFDLGALLCGSEGTLAVITAVRLRLHRPHRRTSLAMVGCQSYDSALALMASARSTGDVIAAESIDATGMKLAESALGLPAPLAREWPVVALIEVADGGDASGLPLTDDHDAVVALEPSEQLRLWSYRERQAEAYATLGLVHKLDVSVPLVRMQALLDDLFALISADATVSHFGFFGHLADGNVHVEFIGPDARDSTLQSSILERVAAIGGSVSAEHGIGRLKAGYLHLSRSAQEIGAMRAIKQAWDPQGLLNPGVLFGDHSAGMQG